MIDKYTLEHHIRVLKALRAITQGRKNVALKNTREPATIRAMSLKLADEDIAALDHAIEKLGADL